MKIFLITARQITAMKAIMGECNKKRFVCFFLNCFDCRLSVVSDTVKKEINELKCQERKMLKQTELIKSALNELGCEEVPSGCDLSIDSQTFISNNSNEQVCTIIFLFKAPKD